MSGHWLKQKWLKQKTCSFSHKYVNIHLLYIFNEQVFEYCLCSWTTIIKGKTTEVSLNLVESGKLMWDLLCIRNCQHLLLLFSLMTYTDIGLRQLDKSRKTAQLSRARQVCGVGMLLAAGGWCIHVNWRLCCLPAMGLPPGVCLGCYLGLLSPGNAPFPAVLNGWREE